MEYKALGTVYKIPTKFKRRRRQHFKVSFVVGRFFHWCTTSGRTKKTYSIVLKAW